MGTDQLGRDVFSRVLYGARSSFALTFLMTGLISVIGTWIGMISGYYGGKLDTLLMRLTDVLLAFPDMIFAIAVAGMLGPGILNTVLALSCIWWTKYARMARGLASVIRTKEYIMEAHLGGAGNWKILMVYIFPNIVPQMIVMAALDVGGMMLAGVSWIVLLRSGIPASISRMGCYVIRRQILYPDSSMDDFLCRGSYFSGGIHF